MAFVMAMHKVPQDVEAEDKFLGPLTFKQFLFAGATLICAYLSFLTITRVWLISPVFILPTMLFAILAFPWSREQPTELFLGSRLRFLIKPKRRIWDQNGIKDLVNISAPIREPHEYTDGLSQGEVKSRLNALATMVDSRGWAVKNVNGQPTIDPVSDRLVSVEPTVPSENSIISEQTPDMLDEDTGEARQFDSMIEQAETKHKDEALRLVEEARKKTSAAPTNPPASKKDEQYWFSEKQSTAPNQQVASFVSPQAITAQQASAQQATSTDISEEELLEKAHEKKRRDNLQLSGTHQVKTAKQKAADQKKEQAKKAQEKSEMTHSVNPDILELSQSNDLSVQTIAHQANKKDSSDDGEVVISLH